MTTALAIKQELTQEQISLIKRQICPNSTDDELKLFVNQCNKTGLDPFSRQIYCLERRYRDSNNVWHTTRSIQISIDGARLIAQRSGQYEGQTPPMWCDEGGRWTDVWLKPTPPTAAKVGVYRSGFREPCYGVALFNEYKGTMKNGELTQFWATKPALMIAKVAEALALRKAFPQELSELYTTEETEQSDNMKSFQILQPKPANPNGITQTQRQELFAKAKEAYGDDANRCMKEKLQRYGYENSTEVTSDDFDKMLIELNDVIEANRA